MLSNSRLFCLYTKADIKGRKKLEVAESDLKKKDAILLPKSVISFNILQNLKLLNTFTTEILFELKSEDY